jgi:hypothetical protein
MRLSPIMWMPVRLEPISMPLAKGLFRADAGTRTPDPFITRDSKALA